MCTMLTCIWCVTKTTVFRRSLTRCSRHRSNICRPTCTSTADRGSSIRNTSRSLYSALATLTRCFWPPLMLMPRSPIYHQQIPWLSWWLQWLSVGLMIERSLVRIPVGALSSQWGQLSLPSLRATGRHLPYGITQRYLPPDASERASPNPNQTGRYSIYLPWRDGRLR